MERKEVRTECGSTVVAKADTTHTPDQVAEEVPVAIVLHVPHVVCWQRLRTLRISRFGARSARFVARRFGG